jgi:hypothetical protein
MEDLTKNLDLCKKFFSLDRDWFDFYKKNVPIRYIDI